MLIYNHPMDFISRTWYVININFIKLCDETLKILTTDLAD